MRNGRRCDFEVSSYQKLAPSIRALSKWAEPSILIGVYTYMRDIHIYIYKYMKEMYFRVMFPLYSQSPMPGHGGGGQAGVSKPGTPAVWDGKGL